ncbi:hypothetical protein OSB04_un001253 [Centaurea solstitialis]|uniref:Uncharacterized protein n=1 Tax=Centaurea solstitialis TaxID=347529 RepID=A0AA38SP11_9ASTR|nr:hypothetical protein OSB04_un001253 [Centaurea solstitialis]
MTLLPLHPLCSCNDIAPPSVSFEDNVTPNMPLNEGTSNLEEQIPEADLDIGKCNDPISYNEAINSDQSSQWIKAMIDELESMSKNDVYELVELPKGFPKDRHGLVAHLIWSYIKWTLKQLSLMVICMNVFMTQPEGFKPKGQEHLVFKGDVFGTFQCPKNGGRKRTNEIDTLCFCSWKPDVCSVCTRPDIAYIAGMLGDINLIPA